MSAPMVHPCAERASTPDLRVGRCYRQDPRSSPTPCEYHRLLSARMLCCRRGTPCLCQTTKRYRCLYQTVGGNVFWVGGRFHWVDGDHALRSVDCANVHDSRPNSHARSATVHVCPRSVDNISSIAMAHPPAGGGRECVTYDMLQCAVPARYPELYSPM